MRLVAFLVLVAAGSLALSCGKNSVQPIDPNSNPAQETPTLLASPSPVIVTPVATQPGTKYGGILVLANRGDPPAGFDSLRTSSIALHHVGGALFGPGNLVMRCRENMYLVCPYLAKSWVVNPGFTEWTFTIRNGAFWHDGTPFNAEDAKFWFELAYFGAKVGDKIRAPGYFKGESPTSRKSRCWSITG